MITWALITAGACREAVARLARGRVADVTDDDRRWLDGYGGGGDGGGGGGGGGYGGGGNGDGGGGNGDGVDGGYDDYGDGYGYGDSVVAVTLCDGTVLRGGGGARQWLRGELERRET